MRYAAALGLGSILALVGCDGGKSTGDGGDDSTLRGDPRIIEFAAASDAVPRGETVELRWKVENAKTVTIFSSTEILVTTPEQEGVVTTLAIRQRSSFTLRATGSGPAVGATVEVDAIWPDPRINEFTADPQTTFQQSTTTLRWQTENAEMVRILANDQPVPNATFVGQAAKAFSTFVVVNTATTTFKLEAINPTSTTDDEVVVYAEPPPQFRRFTATPRTFVGTGTVATIVYDAVGFDLLELHANYYPVSDFPRDQLSGTYTMNVQGTTPFWLVGYVGGVPYLQIERVVAQAAIEYEPNDDPTFPQYISYEGGVVGFLASVSDVDYYVIDVFEASDLRIWVRGEGPGCPVDTSLELIEAFRGSPEPLGTDQDDGIPTGRGGACAEIHPDRDEFARALFGSFVIGVKSERGEAGSYVLMTEALPPGR
jgi:hypothetical protein